MNDKLNMDKQMREKLESFSLAPPPHIFNNVQAQLAMQRKKRRMAYIGYISAAAVIVFAFVAGWYLNENKSGTKPAMVEQKMILAPEETVNKTEAEIKGNQLGNTKIASNTLIQEKTASPIKTKENTETTVAEELNINNSFVASVERASFELMESIEAFLLEDHQISLAQQKTYNPQVSAINETDVLLIAQNTKNYEKQKSSDKGWIVGAHVSPGYSSQSTDYSEQYASNMDYSSDNSSGNVGGGLSIQYKTSKRLRIESGVYYSQNGHSAGNSPRQSEMDYGGNFLFSSPKAITAAPSFSNTVQTNNGGISMNSSAGVINMKTTPKGAAIATYTETIDARNTNTLNTNGEFSQEFEFVEIPLYLRYSVLDKKFGIELLGGVNAGLVIGNNAYIDNDFGKQNVGSTEDISRINLSGTVGLGVNYALGKHFSLAMEPRFNYYLNSINTNPNVNYKPYRLGFYTGIYYEF